MKLLPDKIKKEGNNYYFIKRENNIALYEVKRQGIFLGYSVFIVKTQKETILKMKDGDSFIDVKLENKELFPGENKYGINAWFHKTLEMANEEFQYRLNKINLKKNYE